MAVLWITGAHGFIGRHLAAWLAECGHVVGGIGHGGWPETEAARHGVTCWVNGEIAPSALHLLAESIGLPDAVFHLAGGASVGAAVSAPLEDFTRTVSATMELLDWLRREHLAASVVAVSSAAVYGSGHTGSIAEGAPIRPYSPYGYHKRMMERACESYARAYGLKAVVARLFSVYGPGLRKQLLWDVCSRLERDSGLLKLGGSGAELRDWTHVRDVVRALDHLRFQAQSEPQTFNVGTQRATSVRDIATFICSAWGRERGPTFNGVARAGDPFSLVADCGRIAQTGFASTIEWERGIADYVGWFRNRGR